MHRDSSLSWGFPFSSHGHLDIDIFRDAYLAGPRFDGSSNMVILLRSAQSRQLLRAQPPKQNIGHIGLYFENITCLGLVISRIKFLADMLLYYFLTPLPDLDFLFVEKKNMSKFLPIL